MSFMSWVVFLRWCAMVTFLTGAADNSGSEDDDVTPMGMMDTLKSFGSSHKDIKPKEKAKARPKPGATRPMPPPLHPATNKRKQPATSCGPSASTAEDQCQPKPKHAKVDQIAIGQLGKGKGKGRSNKRQQPEDDALSLGLDMEVTDPTASFSKKVTLSPADQATLDSFEEKFKELMDCSNCPLPDAGYKSFLLEKQGAISTVLGDIRAKKKSAARRAGKEQDPLYIALGDTQAEIHNLSQLYKCGLSLFKI